MNLYKSNNWSDSFFYFRAFEDRFSHLDVERSVVEDEKDCGSTFCTSELIFQTTCILYTDRSLEETCEYPCSTTNCETEIHHSVLCTVWTCLPKTTTSEPVPVITTPKPNPGSDHCTSALCISSVSLNVLILLALLIGISVFLIRRFLNRTRPSNSLENPLFDEGFALFDNFSNEDRNPIIRTSSERRPLLAAEMERQRSSSRSVEPLFAAANDSNTCSISMRSPPPTYEETVL